MEVGQTLFTARQRRGLAIEDISRTTKIPVSILEAIERDDEARLPQGFFTRAFVRAYANEVGVNSDDLLAGFGEVEHVADAGLVHVPIQEPSSSKSLFAAVALAAGCTLFYSGYASQVSGYASGALAPVVPPVAVANVAAPAPFAPPPCAAATPADAPVESVRRPAVALVSEKIQSPAQPVPVAHVVSSATVETSAAAVDASPAVSDAVLPTPEPAPSPAPVEQF